MRSTSANEKPSEPGPREGVGEGKSKDLRCLEALQQGGRRSSRNEQPSEPGTRGGVGEGKSKYPRCLEAFQQGVRGSSRNEQSSEPGPRGGVGEGKSKYLRYLEDKFRDLHALRPEASADLMGKTAYFFKAARAFFNLVIP